MIRIMNIVSVLFCVNSGITSIDEMLISDKLKPDFVEMTDVIIGLLLLNFV